MTPVAGEGGRPFRTEEVDGMGLGSKEKGSGAQPRSASPLC